MIKKKKRSYWPKKDEKGERLGRLPDGGWTEERNRGQRKRQEGLRDAMALSYVPPQLNPSRERRHVQK